MDKGRPLYVVLTFDTVSHIQADELWVKKLDKEVH